MVSPTLASDVCREIGREPVGVIQLEDGGSVDLGAFEILDSPFQERHAVREGLRETLFLLLQDALHVTAPRVSSGKAAPISRSNTGTSL